MTEITAVIDLGKSLAKTIWMLNSSEKREILFLEPEIVNLTTNDIANAMYCGVTYFNIEDLLRIILKTLAS